MTGELQRCYDYLKEQHLNLKCLCFGPRRKRLAEAPGQQHLLDTDGTTSIAAELADPLPVEQPTEQKRKKGHGRRRILKHLPRMEVPHDVPRKDRVCACGRDKVRIGKDVTEQVDYVPGRMTVYRHLYPKYVCPCCKDGVTSAPPAPSPIARGMAGPGLLSYIFVNKFAIHLPTYRQQDVLSHYGFFVPCCKFCDWLAKCVEGVSPLVELMHERALMSLVFNADETPVRMLDRTRTQPERAISGSTSATAANLTRFTTIAIRGAATGRPRSSRTFGVTCRRTLIRLMNRWSWSQPVESFRSVAGPTRAVSSSMRG